MLDIIRERCALVLGHAVMNETFAKQLQSHPEVAIENIGIQPNSHVVKALKSIDFAQLSNAVRDFREDTNVRAWHIQK